MNKRSEMSRPSEWRRRVDELLESTPYYFYQRVPHVITEENKDELLEYVGTIAPFVLQTLRECACAFDFDLDYSTDPMMQHAHNEDGSLKAKYRQGMEIIKQHFNCLDGPS